MRAEDVIERGRRRLRAAAIDTRGSVGNERTEAEQLLEHVLGTAPDDDDAVTPAQVRRFDRLVARREAGEPVAYIVGWTEFNDLKLGIRTGMFIPRATSEFLAKQAIARIRRRKEPVAVDLATGIGPVALSVAHGVPHADVHGADLNPKAVAQARRNAASLNLANASFHTGDLFDALPRALRRSVDVITMHPPYVPRHEVKLLPVEIKNFEPVDSLTDRSRDGLGLVRRLAREGWEWLRPGGWLLVEVNSSTADGVRGVLRRAGYSQVRSTRGEMRYNRVITGRS